MDFIIDGNAYINVAISVTKSICYRNKSIGSNYYVNDIFSEDDNAYILKEEVKLKFRDFCLNYLNSLIAPIGNRIDRVHLVFDSKSWRKEYIKEFFKNDKFTSNVAPDKFEYKANRKKDDKIHLFFNYFQEEIIKHLSLNTGINCFPLCTANVFPTKSGDIIDALDQVLITDFFPVSFIALIFFCNL